MDNANTNLWVNKSGQEVLWVAEGKKDISLNLVTGEVSASDAKPLTASAKLVIREAYASWARKEVA
jgi:hypothetical protein